MHILSLKRIFFYSQYLVILENKYQNNKNLSKWIFSELQRVHEFKWQFKATEHR